MVTKVTTTQSLGLSPMKRTPGLPSQADDRLGTILCGKYRLDSVLGVGGMATVYAATHRNQAELAIKSSTASSTPIPACARGFCGRPTRPTP